MCLFELARHEQHEEEKHGGQARAGEARTGRGPRTKRPEERPEVLGGASHEHQPAEALLKLSERNPPLANFVREPSHAPLGPECGDAHFKTDEIDQQTHSNYR